MKLLAGANGMQEDSPLLRKVHSCVLQGLMDRAMDSGSTGCRIQVLTSLGLYCRNEICRLEILLRSIGLKSQDAIAKKAFKVAAKRAGTGKQGTNHQM